MSTSEKMFSEMEDNPRSWRIEDVIAVAKNYDLLIRTQGGSHHVFGFPGIKYSMTTAAHRPIKAIYIKHFVEFIDKIKG